MRLKSTILLCGILLIKCGNTFAYSPYANTIKQHLSNKSFLTATSFPTTVADASFVTRLENKIEGYKPYFNRSAFTGMTLKEIDELENMADQAEMERMQLFNSASRDTYCKSYPLDTTNCPGYATPSDIAAATTTTNPVSVYPTSATTNNSNVPYMSVALTPENVAKYNLKTHNGGCTPPESNHHWGDKILTSGRYDKIDAAFEKFMITSFRKEGSCGNHPNDRGGYTCYGCASNGLCKGIDMSKVTRPLVEDLYYTNMYKKYNVDKLPDAFRGYMMWGISGSGPVSGIKLFQGALGIHNTGKIDDATIHATETYTGNFHDVYTNLREQFYRNLVAKDPSQKVFLKGWLNGLQLLRPSGCHVVPTKPIYR